MLDERKKMVLQAIVDDYIQSAEPVGSRTIARRHNLGVSPATIRNEMADLEESGYLQQPHVSAGRIPSDKGYRFYVDALMEPKALSDAEKQRIRGAVFARRQEMEKLIHAASTLLAMLTQYVSVVIAPPMNMSVLRHIQLVPIDSHSILVVMVLSPSMVQNKIITTNTARTPEELIRLTAVLNDKLRGITIRELGPSLVKEIKEEVGDIGDALVESIVNELSTKDEEQISLNGTLHIFNQPEFRNLDKVKSLLAALEEKDSVLSILKELSHRSGVQAVIGHESQLTEAHECSIVTATYHLGGEVIGTIGVLGPTRMEYSKSYAVVDLMADSLSEILSELMRDK